MTYEEKKLILEEVRPLYYYFILAVKYPFDEIKHWFNDSDFERQIVAERQETIVPFNDFINKDKYHLTSLIGRICGEGKIIKFDKTENNDMVIVTEKYHEEDWCERRLRMSNKLGQIIKMKENGYDDDVIESYFPKDQKRVNYYDKD